MYLVVLMQYTSSTFNGVYISFILTKNLPYFQIIFLLLVCAVLVKSLIKRLAVALLGGFREKM